MFRQFLSAHPPPLEKDLKELTELAEQIESHWIRETGAFAYNRVTEISERIDYHTKLLQDTVTYHTQLLEEMVIKDKERRQAQETLNQPSTEKAETPGSDSSDLEITFTPPNLTHQGSLHYDDTGADKALLLLQSVETAAQTAAGKMDSSELSTPDLCLMSLV